MYEVVMINNMTEFLEYTQIVSLLKDQMEYIGTPKSSEEIKQTIKLMFTTDYAKLMVLSNHSMLIGFVFFNISIGLQSGGKYLWINEMHIHKHFRGQGYGTILFGELKNWASKNNVLRIMGIVDDIDKRTKNFYVKQGTEIIREDILSLKL